MGTRVGVVWVWWATWVYMVAVQGNEHDKNIIVDLCTKIKHGAYIKFHGTELNWDCVRTARIEASQTEAKCDEDEFVWRRELRSDFGLQGLICDAKPKNCKGKLPAYLKIKSPKNNIKTCVCKTVSEDRYKRR